MQLVSGADSITIKNPQYGYTVDLNLSLVIQRNNKKISSWDNGSEFDFRILEMDLLLPESESIALGDFFNNTDARTMPFTMNVPTGSGFYPAGPDRGSQTEFSASLISHEQSGMKLRPYKWFSTKTRLLLTDFTECAWYPPVSQGPFSIGTVTGLRYPEIQPSARRGVSRTMTHGGSVGYVNNEVDEYSTLISQPCNLSKAAALTEYLQAVRGNDIPVSAPANYYLFGADSGNSGSYTTRLLNNVIRITHENYNRFRVDMELFKQV